MEKKRRKEMEKEALELARHGGEGEQRAAWRDEVDSDQDEEEEKDKRGRKRESRDKDSEKRRGSGERESSRQRHSRSSYHRSHSRSKSPNKVKHTALKLYCMYKVKRSHIRTCIFVSRVDHHLRQNGTGKNQRKMKRTSRWPWYV